jgi:hypothetical protein
VYPHRGLFVVLILALRACNQAVLDGKSDQTSRVHHAQFVEDVLAVIINGSFRKEEFLGDLIIG